MLSLNNLGIRRGWRMLGCVLSLFAWQGGALAHVPTDAEPAETLSRAVASAEAVLHGVVVGVDYGVAQGEENLPYTYVTYQVRKAIRGRSAEEKLTLRFIGGPDGKGRYLTVSGVPLFNVGDEDVLLIQGHGSDDCPLVYCEYGRFQVHEGHVYNARGFPVTEITKDHLRFGEEAEMAVLRKSYPLPDFDALMKNEAVQKQMREQMGDTKAADVRERFTREAPKKTEYAVEKAAKKERADGAEDAKGSRIKPSRLSANKLKNTRDLAATSSKSAVAVDRFVEALSEIAAKQGDSDKLQALSSITPATRYTTRIPRQSEPQAAVAEVKRAPTDDAEKHELEMLREQDFNPVIVRGDMKAGRTRR